METAATILLGFLLMAFIVWRLVRSDAGEAPASPRALVASPPARSGHESSMVTRGDRGGVPAGWYPVLGEVGQERYWNGEAWTGDQRPTPRPSELPRWGLVLGILALGAAFALLAGNPVGVVAGPLALAAIGVSVAGVAASWRGSGSWMALAWIGMLASLVALAMTGLYWMAYVFSQLGEGL